MRSVIIVGGGLFGSITAHWLSTLGHDVTILDSRESFAGSAPAACLMRPSWMTMLKDVDRGFELLDHLYGLKQIGFKVEPVGKYVNVTWVDPASVLGPWNGVKYKTERVTHVDNGRVECESGLVYEGTIIVCAGVWTSKLLPHIAIKAQTGAALTFDKRCKMPKISVWAPYRQAVSFERDHGRTWFGDGTAILRKNFGSAHVDRTVVRAREHGLPKTRLVKTQVGMRPYIAGHKAGYLEELAPDLIVNTGGAKNGTMIAALNALRIEEMLG